MPGVLLMAHGVAAVQGLGGTMVEVSVESDTAVFELQHLHKLWALRSRLTIPLRHIAAVHADPTLSLGFFERLKLAGAYLPGILAAGTFWEDGGLVFWDVHDPANAVVFELKDETYRRLVVEVAHPAEVVALIRQHLGAGPRTSMG
jgi:hypothetical protein